MAFTVGQRVIAQKLGGQSGTKNVSPAFHGAISHVLAGSKYKIDWDIGGGAPMSGFFPNGEVDEAYITAE